MGWLGVGWGCIWAIRRDSLGRKVSSYLSYGEKGPWKKRRCMNAYFQQPQNNTFCGWTCSELIASLQLTCFYVTMKRAAESPCGSCSLISIISVVAAIHIWALIFEVWPQFLEPHGH
jgi:hypothetical protein